MFAGFVKGCIRRAKSSAMMTAAISAGPEIGSWMKLACHQSRESEGSFVRFRLNELE